MSDSITIEILNNIIELDYKCKWCYGEGTIATETDNEICASCNGAGFELSTEGEAIMKLVRRHKFIGGK